MFMSSTYQAVKLQGTFVRDLLAQNQNKKRILVCLKSRQYSLSKTKLGT